MVQKTMRLPFQDGGLPFQDAQHHGALNEIERLSPLLYRFTSKGRRGIIVKARLSRSTSSRVPGNISSSQSISGLFRS
jgi:hypothetical protein